MQSINAHLTEQDQQRFTRELQDPNDEIGEHSDEDEEDDSEEDEYVNVFFYITNFYLPNGINRKLI